MCFSALVKVVIFLTFFPYRSSAGTHSLQILTTHAREISFPNYTVVGLVDEEEILYYDSTKRKLMPKAEWVKKIDAEDPDFWNRYTQIVQGFEEHGRARLATLMELFNQTKGVHTWQSMFGCELDIDAIREYEQHGFDGENFYSLDLNTLTYIAENPKGDIFKQEWEDRGSPNFFKNYLEKDCILWLKKCLSFGRETLERKDPPEVSVFHEPLPSPELVCHATGFFPKGLMIFWQKDGEELHEDVEIRETVPNQDGTFQKRAVLRVSPEELKEHDYTCVVQHSSMEKDLVLKAPDEGSLGAGAIVGIVLAAVAGVAFVVAVGVLMWRKKNPVVRTRSSSIISTSSNSNTSQVSSSSE